MAGGDAVPDGTRIGAQLGAQLRAARLAARMSMAEVAEQAGLTKGFVSKLERDLANVSVASLIRLCDALGIDFQESMLAWPPGPRTTDGVWAKHWYAEVERSTGFRPYQPKEIDLPEHVEALYSECLEDYQLLYSQRLE